MRSFEAAARLGGFAAAADELGVTPGAVSQQVKALEEWIGTPLFERHSQGVRLSAVGQRACADFSTAFDHLGMALQKLRIEAPDIPIQIAALPSVAQLWLPPRLAEIRREMPGHRVTVTATEAPPNLRREIFDLTIFFDRAEGAADSLSLAEDEIFPVCAPELAEELTTLDALRDATLLHDVTWAEDWPSWLSHAGWQGSTPAQCADYSLYAIALEEAVNGGGVLMGHGPLVARHLSSGALVTPYGTRVRTGRALMLSLAHVPAPGSPIARIWEMLSVPA